jgi:hypothetical protein
MDENMKRFLCVSECYHELVYLMPFQLVYASVNTSSSPKVG